MRPRPRAGGRRAGGAAQRGRIVRHGERDEFSRRAVGGRGRDDGAPPHARLPRDRDLNLARLDEIAADLHLTVEAADELDRAVGQPAREVAHPIGALTCVRRMREALLRGLLRIVGIAARETRARDDNLADGAALRLAQSLVEYRDPRAAAAASTRRCVDASMRAPARARRTSAGAPGGAFRTPPRLAPPRFRFVSVVSRCRIAAQWPAAVLLIARKARRASARARRPRLPDVRPTTTQELP
ncbi:hypothetical protein [Burkholderia pseudomallei]|uniref:hypothetical protein n=1 Tax=Burkholderia pseudomallei TaxID=28450 RepID=UPI003132CD4D